MGKAIGVLCILLGVCCLLGAGGFLLYNSWEAEQAGEFSATILQDIKDIIIKEEKPVTPPSPEQKPVEMPTLAVDEYDCIGILSVPVLRLELPVLTDWSYAKLKKAPCHYYGSYYEGDFVIAAHNYPAHFGRLSELQPGDLVVFTDIRGVSHPYEVVLLETLPKEATEEMIRSGFDLSLYTCTPAGGSRVTVRCRAKEN